MLAGVFLTSRHHWPGGTNDSSRIARDESESVFFLDQCGMLPSKQQCKDGTLCNRLLMCTVAVGLLWFGALDTVVYIVSHAVRAPAWKDDIVEGYCLSAFDYTKDQRAEYESCVDRQLDDCTETFEDVLNSLVHASNVATKANDIVLASAASYHESCSDAYSSAHSAVKKWLSLGIDYTLHYSCDTDDDDGSSPYCNATCSVDDDNPNSCSCTEVADMVGDLSALRTAAYESAEDYSDFTYKTISSIVDYTVDRQNCASFPPSMHTPETTHATFQNGP